MEKIYKRSDGFFEDSSGQLAVVMTRVHGVREEHNYFTFVSSFTATPIEVRWALDDEVLILPSDVATLVLRNDYARLPTMEEVESYNEALQPENDADAKAKADADAKAKADADAKAKADADAKAKADADAKAKADADAKAKVDADAKAKVDADAKAKADADAKSGKK